MSNESIFGETPPEDVVPPVIPSLTIPPEASEFVGEGKKYKSVEDALRSVPNAQKHINTLEDELKATREELAKRQTTEEILNQIKSGIVPNETPIGNTLDPSVLANIVNQQLSAREAQRTQADNTNKVTSTFSAKYGDKAEETYIKIAQESGLSIAELNRLSATAPNAVFRLAGLDSKVGTASIGSQTSTVNTELLNNTQVNTNLSAKVPQGATSKQVAQAWRNAGEKIKQNL